MKQRIILWATVVMWSVSSVYAQDFELTGSQQRSITDEYSTGTLRDLSGATLYAEGYIDTVYLYDQSMLNVLEQHTGPYGRNVATAYVYQNSVVTLSAGRISGIHAYDAADIHIHGGIVSGWLWAWDDSTVSLTDGSIRYLGVYDLVSGGPIRATISGGTVEHLYDSLTLTD